MKVLTPEPVLESPVHPEAHQTHFWSTLLKIVAWGVVVDLSVRTCGRIKEALTRKNAGGSSHRPRQKPDMRGRKQWFKRDECKWQGSDRLRPLSPEAKEGLDAKFLEEPEDLGSQVDRYLSRDLERAERLRQEFVHHLPPMEEFLA